MMFDIDTLLDKENEVQVEKETQVIYHKKYKYHEKWEVKKFSTYWCAIVWIHLCYFKKDSLY